MEWSPRPTLTTRESERESESKTDSEERKSPYREGRDGLLVLSAGSEGAARMGEEKKEKMEKREREMVVIMGLMCNKLHEGAFREALLSSSTHTPPQRRADTHTLHTRRTQTQL